MRTALVTGASRGLGLALARALAQQRFRLVIDARGDAALEDVRAELAQLTEVTAIPGNVADEHHRGELVDAVGDRLELLVNNASALGPSPLPELASYPLTELRRVYEVNVLAPLALIQSALPLLRPSGTVINVTSDAAVEPYEGWGGYGSSKAALDQLTRVLAAEQPDLHIYAVDPGDMRTQMQQDAFPGEDISDRPPPEDSVPGIVTLLDGRLPSGRYAVAELAEAIG
jgi:NAD(P)-dependent dehydrogenase (short-subunit alcohol dehydrogenase family)